MYEFSTGRKFVRYRVNVALNINTSVTIHWHGVGGRTIDKVRRFDLTELERFKPDVVFLQIGTNDLTRRRSSPASVGSVIEDFVCLLHHEYGVSLVCVGQTVKRHPVGTFNANVQILTQYLQGVLEPLPFAKNWTHRGFWRASSSYLSYDGVHLKGKSGHADATVRLTASGLSDSLRGRTEQLIYTVDCEQALFCTKPLNLFETNEHFKMAETVGRKYRGRVVFETRCFSH